MLIPVCLPTNLLAIQHLLCAVLALAWTLQLASSASVLQVRAHSPIVSRRTAADCAFRMV